MAGLEPREVIVIAETLGKSIARDAVTFVMIVGVIGTGRYLDSPAMQWMGFIILIIAALGRAASISRNAKMSPQAAADLLATKFNVRAKA